jgi:hypothetical protein
MNWNEVVEKVAPSIVKIETPRGHGTGFLCFYNEPRNFCGIATAHHVVEHADEWQEPIRIIHQPSKSVRFLQESDRVIWVDRSKDSAVIVTSPAELKLPENAIPLLPVERRLPIGVEVGWLGYPAMAEYTLCFFSGNVSAWQDWRNAYLVDGVAINGVSGGPVIYSTVTDGVQIVGSIAAYYANRATGEALPGLSVAQDVSHFQESISRIRTIDEANRQKQTLQQQSTDAPPGPPPAPARNQD